MLVNVELAVLKRKGTKSVNKLINQLIIVSLLSMCLATRAEAEVAKHHQIMAGFLLHFTSFTQWKSLEDNSINLCLLGPEPFKSYINEMVKRRPKNSQGETIVLNYVDKASQNNLNNCQIIYLQPEHYQSMWQNIGAMQNTLLVSQSSEFISQGGMINFVLKNKRVKLEVNLPAVKAAQLKISSELLKHAKIIDGTPHNKYIKKM